MTYDDPWTRPATPGRVNDLPDALGIRDLALVTVPDVERITSAKAIPLFAATLTAIVGPSETGKTTLAAHAVLDVATAGQRVIVFDGEMSASAWRRKLEQLGATDADLARIAYAEMTANSADVDLVRTAVTIFRPRLVLWDSALSLISRTCRSENDNSEVGKLMDRLREIVRDGPSGLLVDHSPKDSASPISRGASAKFAALDVSLGVRISDGAVPGPLENWSTVLSVEKDRHALLGARADREVTYIPLGSGQLAVDIAELDTSSHRLSAGSPVAEMVARIAALDPPASSANDAYKRLSGRRQTIQIAYKKWSETA